MTRSDDWSDLSLTWADPAADELSAVRADAALIRSVRRRDLLARLNFASELLGCGVVIAVVVWASIRTDLPWPVNVAAFAFIAFGMGLTLWSRRGDPGVLTETPEAVLRSAIAQARTGERWAAAGVANSIAAFAFLGVMQMLVPPSHDSLEGIPVFVVFLLACIAACIAHARRCRRRKRAHEAALAALEAG